MIIVRLKGGMGNQMFQYACGRALSLRHNVPLKLDTSFYDLNLKGVTKRGYDLDVFTIQADIAEQSDIPFLYKLYSSKLFVYFVTLVRKFFKSKGQEKSFNFDASIFNKGDNLFLDGYWQSPKYFSDIEEVIRKDFIVKEALPENIQKLALEIKSQNSLCVHVRRGDYVGNATHEVVTNTYYKDAVEVISGKTTLGHVYVFSDDIAWCRENVQFDIPTTYVGDEYAGKKAEGNLFLMSLCNHFIIANSSFSWWAAWLSPNKSKIVVCPKQWFADASIDASDVIPLDWIKM